MSTGLYKYYCPNHNMRIVEYGIVRFIENGNISGSMKSQNMAIQEVKVQVPLPITFSKVVIPTIVEQYDNLEEQQITYQIPRN